MQLEEFDRRLGLTWKLLQHWQMYKILDDVGGPKC